MKRKRSHQEDKWQKMAQMETVKEMVDDDMEQMKESKKRKEKAE
jgi:hypothetical protein